MFLLEVARQPIRLHDCQVGSLVLMSVLRYVYRYAARCAYNSVVDVLIDVVVSLRSVEDESVLMNSFLSIEVFGRVMHCAAMAEVCFSSPYLIMISVQFHVLCFSSTTFYVLLLRNPLHYHCYCFLFPLHVVSESHF